jgi:hypothetical protein
MSIAYTCKSEMSKCIIDNGLYYAGYLVPTKQASSTYCQRAECGSPVYSMCKFPSKVTCITDSALGADGNTCLPVDGCYKNISPI